MSDLRSKVISGQSKVLLRHVLSKQDKAEDAQHLLDKTQYQCPAKAAKFNFYLTFKALEMPALVSAKEIGNLN